MALYTENELSLKLTGAITNLVSAEYTRASAYSDAIVNKWISSTTDDTTFKKQISLELGYVHVMLERFQEEREHGSATMLRQSRAMFNLRSRA